MTIGGAQFTLGSRRMQTMRSYPDTITIDGTTFEHEKILKEDFFSVNVLYRADDGARYVLKLSDFRFIGGRLLRPVAALMSAREYRVYRHIADIPGIPLLGPRYGRRGYYHVFIEGKTLHELTKDDRVPDEFFSRLRETFDQIHSRRVIHIDTDKRGNIIWGTDGRPYVIDFQISLHLKERRGILGRIANRLFDVLCREDIYHVYKHKTRFRPDLMTDQELVLAERSGLNTWFNTWIGKPYRTLKRKIYPSGSNEIIWYKWKRVEDQSKRMP